ncbi:Probable RNA-directed DNA polymerase from transposon X-element [Eumeta japonica]|uniref:Probable RNA-directed DNA polymerase from transposon X-element n=1 Tax=Eumeta variegata TaxID=151549 RepID=A0A4C1UDG8_EUMVA|nr:Probable RNA-directed DNA polymerase from transposon X-element [Eumeta japonica]
MGGRGIKVRPINPCAVGVQAAGDDLPASYKPISILSVLGKLYGKTLKTRLNEHLIGEGLIINGQFGFRPNHFSPQQALRLVEYVFEGFKTKRKTVAIVFDVAKAIDRISPSRSKNDISMSDWPTDEGVKAVGFRHRSHKFFRRFLVCASRTHPCAWAHGRPIMGFFPPSPLSLGEIYKKRLSLLVRVQRPTGEEPQRKGEAASTEEGEASAYKCAMTCSVQQRRGFIFP